MPVLRISNADGSAERLRSSDPNSCVYPRARDLREAIENGYVSWPAGVVTDGADHFVIRRDATRRHLTEPAQSGRHSQERKSRRE
jgi:hypothetical protein